MVEHALFSAVRRQRQENGCDFEESPLYSTNCRITRTVIQRNLASKKQCVSVAVGVGGCVLGEREREKKN